MLSRDSRLSRGNYQCREIPGVESDVCTCGMLYVTTGPLENPLNARIEFGSSSNENDKLEVLFVLDHDIELGPADLSSDICRGE